jgi:hypothetical protein
MPRGKYINGMLWEMHFERGGALRGRNEGVLSKKNVTVNHVSSLLMPDNRVSGEKQRKPDEIT